MSILISLMLLVAAPEAGQLPTLRTVDGHFLDRAGDEVRLRGVNIISKNAATRYKSEHTEEDFARLREWGMNCVRLGILWDGVEPAPGEYDESYLDYVAMRVEQAARHGLYVFLDMHQDLYSVKYSDGAPAWATLDGGMPHVTGSVWSDSYLLSPAVQTAFDNFWANAPGPGGVGIQDRYAAMWAHVAKRFADTPSVIGYDLMNEPFPGSVVKQLPAAISKSRLATLLEERLGEGFEPASLSEQWYDPEGRSRITALFNDMEVYKAFTDAQDELNRHFEQESLMPMYRRVATAIRAVDSDGILFLETSYLCNAGVRSGIEPIVLNGVRDSQQAFAPHGYDIVVDTPDLAKSNPERLAYIFRRHAETAARLEMPILVGEWGAFGSAGPEVRAAVQQVIAQLDEYQCSDTYWDYGHYLLDADYRDLLRREPPAPPYTLPDTVVAP